MDSFKNLLAIDLDGTLLSKTKKIKKQDFVSLKKYYDHGGNIVIITGKSVSSGLKYIKKIETELNIKLKYASFLAGSVVYDLINSKIVFEESIKKQLVNELSRNCLENKINFLGVTFLDGLDKYFLNRSFWFNFLSRKILIKNNVYKIINKPIEVELNKINIFKKWYQPYKFKELHEKLKRENMFNICHTNEWFLEITSKDINKASALKFICDKLEIPLSDTAAIGDSDNDISMLSICSLSFGIDNKKENFRKSAKILISRNKKCPVSFAINHMLS